MSITTFKRLNQQTIQTFLNICNKEIKKGNCHLVNRSIDLNGKKINSKQALLNIGILTKKQLWNYILDLKVSECLKVTFDHNKKMDNNSEIYIFKKKINQKEVYIKLTLRESGVICISFHESYEKASD